MILPPFDSARAKIAHGREHIADVEAIFNAYQNEAPLVKDVSLFEGRDCISWKPSKPLPVKLILVLGDAIHNMRAALDYMAGDVVRLSDGNPANVHFPIAQNEADYDKQIKKKRFHQARADAIDLLKSFKPYTGGNRALRALHDLDLTDKHKLLISTDQGSVIPTVRIGRMVIEGGHLIKTKCAFSLPVGTEIEVLGNVLPSLMFAQGTPLAGQHVIPTLQELCDLTLGIVEAFAGLFKN